MARSLLQALEMPLAERQRRHEALLASIAEHDARAWMTGFLDALEEVRQSDETDGRRRAAAG